MSASSGARLSPLGPYWIDKLGIFRSLSGVAHFAGGRMLDLGCGESPYDALFSAVDEYVGLDRSRNRAAGPLDRPAVIADALALPFRSGSFDTVLCTQVLDDVPEPAELLRQSARVLRPGGYLILTAQLVWEIHDAPHDYFRFTQFGIRHLVQEAGLVTELVEPRWGFWAALAQLLAVRFIKGFLRSPFGRVPGSSLITALIQGAGLLLDRLDPDQSLTLGYVCVARRPALAARSPQTQQASAAAGGGAQ